MKKSCLAVLMLFVFILMSQNVYATTWNWSFANESGKFVTDGTSQAAGTYILQDFIVSSSTTSGTIGSLLGGQYNTNAFSTDQPFSFYWDGSSVTAWYQSGFNSFDWWAFGQSGSQMYYFFGWDTYNINDATKAAHFDADNFNTNTCYTVTVTAENGSTAPVPEPGTIALLGLGMAGLAVYGKRRKNTKA